VQQRNSIITKAPLPVALALSIAIHVAGLYCKGFYTPSALNTEAGRTSVLLTLMPSIESPAATTQPQPKNETQPEPVPAPVTAPIPEPQPEETPAAETEAAPAMEESGSPIEDKGAVTAACTNVEIDVPYPRMSRRRGEEGTVVLLVHVYADGRVGHIDIARSSGHRRLDEAAVKAARSTTFTPAMQFGRNIDSTTRLSFTFQLTDD